MKILAIDTSGKSASIAILENESVLNEILFNVENRHSEILLPAVESLCRSAGVKVKEMDLFVCTIGPGSFTGLRIGVSTAKGLALATGKPVVGVSTLEALTFNATPSPSSLCPMLDARKDQVYAAIFKKEPVGDVLRLCPDVLSNLDDLLERVIENTLFLGDGAVRYRQSIETALPGRCHFADPCCNLIRGAAVGILGYQKYVAGGGDDVLSLAPRYLRIPEAEEKMSLKKAPTASDKY